MHESLLNENQQRRVATFLHLLVKDMERLKAFPDLGGPIHHALDDVLRSIQHLVSELDLTLPSEPDVLHHVRTVAEMWGIRAYDIRAAALQGYGSLHPDLDGRLDPLVEGVRTDLRALAHVAKSE